MNSPLSSPRRLVSLLAATVLAVSGLAVSVSTLTDHSRPGTYEAIADLAAHCDEVIHVEGIADSCAHSDKAPKGVDVDKHVPTRELESREGAAAAAVEAAEDEGVPVPAELAAVSDTVPCDGDGTSGHRVQAMYVVASGSTNRYPAVVDQIKQWAAGVNTVFSLSAAKTGGTRDVRYVTSDNGDGTCSPTVLNITVPAGSFSTFNATINAVRDLGYTSPARKYLMWVDGTGQCGIAQTYTDSRPGQDNPNNGYAAQFARIDTGCWGQSASVEAHELSHTMGSVQADAPHATNAGHCYDESDRMCYADGGGKAMQQVCAADQEILFDCNDDDYFSTFPTGGSYLATHWNTADSRWLIGGGDGSGGGTDGIATKLGGTMTVNNPAVAGLPTQASVSLEVPAGRTAAVAWTSRRRDCVFSDRTAEQTSVTCDAKSLGATTVTATITDSSGEKIVRTVPLTFSLAARTVQPALQLDGSSSSSYTACQGGKGILTTKVVDQSTGLGVKGIGVTWTKKVGVANPTSAGTAVTNADGVATSRPVALVAATYSAATKATKAVASVTNGAVNVTIASGSCTTGLDAGVVDDSVLAGDSVAVTGTLTRTVPGGSAVPAAGEKVTVYGLVDGATTWRSMGSATTTADGTYSAIVKPVVNVTLQARFKARVGLATATATDIPVTVSPRTTSLTSSLSAAEVMAGVPVTVTGTLSQATGSGTAPLPSSPVLVTYPIAGGKFATVRATTKATGIYTAIIKAPVLTGDVTIKYAGKTGWSPSSRTETLTVNDWTSTLTMSAVRNASTGTVLVTGKLLVTDEDGSTVPKKSGKVTVTYQATASATKTVTATTKTTGDFTVSVKPTVTGSVTATFAAIPGWGTASATPVTITVP
jgi:hypothetical protein